MTSSVQFTIDTKGFSKLSLEKGYVKPCIEVEAYL